MPPAQISAYARYYQPAVSVMYFVASIANYLAPTRGELDAGLNITRQVREINGWGVEGDQIETPDFSSLFVAKIAGRTSAPDSSLTLYGTKSGADIRTTLPRGTTGYIVIMPGGDVSGYKMDVFPISVRAVSKQHGDKDAFAMMVQVSITAQPAEDVTIP